MELERKIALFTPVDIVPGHSRILLASYSICSANSPKNGKHDKLRRVLSSIIDEFGHQEGQDQKVHLISIAHPVE